VKTKLIGYFSIGYPDVERSMEIADSYVKSGIDIIEIGFPCDNPYLDNEYIGNTLKCAYNNFKDADAVFDAVDELLKRHADTPVILLMYDHIIRDYVGVDKFIERASKSGIKDIILVGSEDESVKDTLISNGFNVSCYITYGLPDNEIESARNSNAFIYLQAKPDGNVRPGCETLAQCVKYLRDKGIKNPIYAGVGISTPDDVKMVAEAKAEGCFIGSALLKKTGDIKQLEEYVKSLKDARDSAEI
jgi:tryptophan synthase, alpha subunit